MFVKEHIKNFQNFLNFSLNRENNFNKRKILPMNTSSLFDVSSLSIL